MRRLAFIQLFLASLLLASILAVYGFWYAEVGKASAEAAKLSDDILTKSQDSARVTAAKAALVSLAGDEASVTQYLIPPGDVVPFLESLEQTGKALGATVEVVSVASEATKERGHLALSLKISGPFDAVLRTLGAIEYGPYDSSLTGLTFDTPRSDTEGAQAWTAAATFSIGTQAPS